MRKELSGQVFGRLTVIEPIGQTNRNMWKWKCICSCGNEIIVQSANLSNGNSKSCGCWNREKLKKSNTKHGLTLTPEYSVWSDIKTRCYNKKCKAYNNYGGRGISVCDRWLNSFEDFLSDVGKRPSKLYTLDRFPDVNGNYDPLNFRWATWEQQQNNRRDNKSIEYMGVKLTHSQWSRLFGRPNNYLYKRLKTRAFEYLFNLNKHNIKTWPPVSD